MQDTSEARRFQVPHPIVHCHVLYAACVCGWHTKDISERRMCDCVCAHPLLYSGLCHVDGSRGCAHVPETGSRVCQIHH